MKEFLVTEWNHAIGETITGGSQWQVKELFVLKESEVWSYILAAIKSVAHGEKRAHFSIKELTAKISTRSIGGAGETDSGDKGGSND